MTSFYTKEHKGRIGIIKSAKLASFFHIFSPSLIHFSASILSSNLTGLLAFLSSPFYPPRLACSGTHLHCLPRLTTALKALASLQNSSQACFFTKHFLIPMVLSPPHVVSLPPLNHYSAWNCLGEQRLSFMYHVLHLAQSLRIMSV